MARSGENVATAVRKPLGSTLSRLQARSYLRMKKALRPSSVRWFASEQFLADDLLARLVDDAELVVGVGEDQRHFELVGQRQVQVADIVRRLLVAVPDEELDHADVLETLLLQLIENAARLVEQGIIERVARRADDGAQQSRRPGREDSGA